MNTQQPIIEGESEAVALFAGSGGEADLVAGRLSQLHGELSSQPQSAETAAIDVARVVSPAYVDNDAFLLLFLRADKYNPKRARERLKSHFRKKMELFGPHRLGNPITLADLNAEDKVSLLSAGAVLLPDKDSQGRLILVTRYRMMRYSETANMSRAFWFLMMTVLEAGLVQNGGIIWIVIDDDSTDATVTTKVEEPVLAELAACAMSLPIRVAALHLCTSKKSQGPTTRDFLTDLIAASNNIQTQLHNGSPLTWIQHLVSAGIPVQGIVPLFEQNVPAVDGQTTRGTVVAHNNPSLGSSLDGGRKRSAGEALGPISKVQRTENTTSTSINHQNTPVTEAPEVVRGRPSDESNPLPGVLTDTACPPFCLTEKKDSQGMSVTTRTHFSQPQVKQHTGQNRMNMQPSVSLSQPGMIPITSDPTPPGTTSSTPFPQNTHLDTNGPLRPMLANVKTRQPSAAQLSSFPSELPFLLGTMHPQNLEAMQLLLNPATIAHMLGNAHRMQIPHIGGPSQLSELQNPPASTVATMQSGTNAGTTSLQPPQALTSHPLIPSIQPTHRSGRPPLPLYSKFDDATLSAYQCLVRQQIEMFEATQDDVQFNISRMSKTIVLGQVGIRCRHCSVLPQYSRPKAAVYYPRTLDSLYQFGQNMVKNHLCVTCKSIPQETKNTLITLQEERRRGKGGRERWAEAAREMGVFEDPHGLRFG